MIEGKRIFVTGGTGFFGNSLQQHCVALSGNDIVFLSKGGQRSVVEDSPFLAANRVSYVDGDVRDFVLHDTGFDYVIHAATTSCSIIPDTEMESVVIDGTRRVLEFAGRNSNLLKLLYVSSGAVYGSGYQTRVEETQPCRPEDVYGRSKHIAEAMCREAGVPCTIARCFTFLGEYLPLDAHFAVGNFIKNCMDGEDIVIRSDGTPVRTYMYASDLAAWLVGILVGGQVGEAYNVGSDEEVSIAELAEAVRRVVGGDNAVRVLASPGSGPRSFYVPDITKARRELGLRIDTRLIDGLAAVVAFHRQAETKRSRTSR